MADALIVLSFAAGDDDNTPLASIRADDGTYIENGYGTGRAASLGMQPVSQVHGNWRWVAVSKRKSLPGPGQPPTDLCHGETGAIRRSSDFSITQSLYPCG